LKPAQAGLVSYETITLLSILGILKTFYFFPISQN